MHKHLVKSLIAVAVASASFGAHAVDVYGNVDAGYTNVDAVGGKVQALTSGIKDPSFIGFRGAENLGGGLKAEFVLEKGFDLSTGADNGNGFNRNSYIGLSGGFGALKLGQFSTLSRDLVKKYDAFGGEMWGAGFGVFNTFGGFQSETIGYSNSFGPVKAAVTHKLAGIPGGGLSDGAVTSIAAGYDQGPISVGFAYTEDKSVAGTKGKVTQLGGSYALGFGSAYALYQDAKKGVATDAETAYLVGFKAPVGGATSVLASVGQKEEFGGVKHNLFSLGGEYSLSKRTAAYASFVQDDVKHGENSNGFAVGVSHKF